jgi:hypothetical protein
MDKVRRSQKVRGPAARKAAVPDTKKADVDRSAIAAGGSALLGAGGAVGAVAALGVPGLGATGISSGLATGGALVGGGMAVGVAVTVAAPVVAGAVGECLARYVAFHARRAHN